MSKKKPEMVVEVAESQVNDPVIDAEVTSSMLPSEPVEPVATVADAAPLAAPVAPEPVAELIVVPPAPPRQPSEFVNRMVAWLSSRGVEQVKAIPQDDGGWLLTSLYVGALDHPEGAEIIRSELAPAYLASFRLEGLVSRVVQDGERLRVEFKFSEVV